MSGRLMSEDATAVVKGARLLFVHAHPDDETLTTGLNMASYASRHHDVHLLTCTLGEEGEMIPPALAHLGADRDDTLGLWRREELRSAMSVLGVTHSVLGEDPYRGVASRYRDSGMAGTASAEHPDAFGWASQDRAWLRENVVSEGSNCVVLQQAEPYPPSVVPDETVTHVVEEPALVEIQSRALAQHATQVIVYEGYYALSNHITSRLSGREGFAQFDPVAGHLGPATLGASPYNPSIGSLSHLQGHG